MSDTSLVAPVVETIYEAAEELSSVEPPMSEWSSLADFKTYQVENIKVKLYEQGLYSPGSGDICNKYIAQSASSVLRHPYYNYPPVLDPGIQQALLNPESPVIYHEDGQDLYLDLCAEMKQCVVGIFHRNLLNSQIDLSYYGVNPFGIRAMAMALEHNKTVRIFNLTDNFLNDDSCYHLGRMLVSNTTIEELNLAGCRIGASGLRSLGHSLHLNKTLKSLNLARNKIEDAGGVDFAKIIFNGANFKKINLSYNNLAKETATELAEVLDFQNNFTHIDLSWNLFSHIPSCMRLIEVLAVSKFLKELNLSYCSLEGRVGLSLGYLCINCPTLKVLDVSHNRLQGEGVTPLLNTLIKNKTLVTLNLSNNPMSPEDADFALGKMLRPAAKLKNLFMENVNVNKHFLEKLKKVRKMKSRADFVVTYGIVLANWTVLGPDPRTVILRRADYVASSNKKRRVDIALYFLKLRKQVKGLMLVSELVDRFRYDSVPSTPTVIEELGFVFAGPKIKKAPSVNIESIAEYIERLWPDRKLPPTPPPEPEPEPPPPPPSAAKGKGKGKAKK